MTDFVLVGVARVAGGLPVVTELIAGQYEVGGPTSSVAFRFPDPGERLLQDEAPYGGFVSDLDGRVKSRDLELFEVIVEFSADVDPRYAIEHRDSPEKALLRDAVDAAYAIARAKVSLLHRWTRLERPWLGHGDPDATSVGPVLVRRLDTGERVAVGRPTITLAAVVTLGAAAVSETEMGELVRRLRADTEPPPLSSMLADALFLGRWRKPPDIVGAVLLAAIACEVKAKEVLLDLAPEEASRLLDLMLTEPRVFPQPAQELFHTVPKAVLGRSLHEEDPETFKRVRTLFERRNQIAHRGQDPEMDVVEACLTGAKAACSWLDSLAP